MSREPVTIVVGPTAREQEVSFMNSTLQTAATTPDKPAVAISVATFVVVPDDVTKMGAQAVADHLALILGFAAHESNGNLRFEVEVGVDEDWWQSQGRHPSSGSN